MQENEKMVVEDTMGITGKLNYLYTSTPDKNQLYVAKEELEWIFGKENIETMYQANFPPFDHYVFFEEEDVLYYALVNEDVRGKKEFKILQTNNNFYDQANNELYEKFLVEERRLQFKLSGVKRITDHHSFKLKTSF